MAKKHSRIKKIFRSKKRKSISPHKSFKRTYREDYVKETKAPGILQHAMQSFGVIFKNWKLFLPFIIIIVLMNVLFVGLMSESNYVQFQDILDNTSAQIAGKNIGDAGKAALLLVSTVTTGGLSGEASETSVVFGVLLFLTIWLVTIFLVRHLMAGHKLKLRDGLYNAMTPLISTLLVFLVVAFQCIPIFIFIITYSAAVQTEFLTMPFYAFLFWMFALVMFLISIYLLSSSLIALIAVSAPGMYPMRALRIASELMMGRRVKFIIRLIALVLILCVVWVVIMFPLILFDLWMKTFEWTSGIPFVPICLSVMTTFTCVYITVYLYKYYRYMLDN